MIWLAIVVLGVVALVLHELEHAPIVDESYEFRLRDEIAAGRWPPVDGVANWTLQESERKKFFKQHGTPPIGLNSDTGPHEVFGDRYLVRGREMKEKMAELNGLEHEIRLNLSLDPSVMMPVPKWVLEMWEAESRRNVK